MQTRVFGRTGLELSILGFGCGAVGGLMVRGTAADQDRAIGRALDAGVNYFDTAVQYGNGESERALGRALAAAKATDAVVGTKVRLMPADMGAVADAVARSLEGSLQRLGRERVDILHLHNRVGNAAGGDMLTARQILDDVVPAFARLRGQGKLRFLGLTATGDTLALHEVVRSGAFDSAQIVVNMLNPSAGMPLPAGHPAQDYGRLLDLAAAAGTGVIGIRVLAGGALSPEASAGQAARHPIASPPPPPIGSAASYAGDLALARRLLPLIEEGFAASLAEAATRFALGHPAMGPILVGVATPEQFEHALDAVGKGPLPTAALERLADLQRGFAGSAKQD